VKYLYWETFQKEGTFNDTESIFFFSILTSPVTATIINIGPFSVWYSIKVADNATIALSAYAALFMGLVETLIPSVYS